MSLDCGRTRDREAPSWESNRGPSCCEATVPTTENNSAHVNIINAALFDVCMVAVKCSKWVWVWFCNLVPLVVESYPGDSGVARTSEADDLLRVTPLEHPHATILSSSQVWQTIKKEKKKKKGLVHFPLHLDEHSGPNMLVWHFFAPKITYFIIDGRNGLLHTHMNSRSCVLLGADRAKHLTTQTLLWLENTRS